MWCYATTAGRQRLPASLLTCGQEETRLLRHSFAVSIIGSCIAAESQFAMGIRIVKELSHSGQLLSQFVPPHIKGLSWTPLVLSLPTFRWDAAYRRRIWHVMKIRPDHASVSLNRGLLVCVSRYRDLLGINQHFGIGSNLLRSVNAPTVGLGCNQSVFDLAMQLQGGHVGACREFLNSCPPRVVTACP